VLCNLFFPPIFFWLENSVSFPSICDICNTHAILFYSITSKLYISVVTILTVALTLQSSPLAVYLQFLYCSHKITVVFKTTLRHWFPKCRNHFFLSLGHEFVNILVLRWSPGFKCSVVTIYILLLWRCNISNINDAWSDNIGLNYCHNDVTYVC